MLSYNGRALSNSYLTDHHSARYLRSINNGTFAHFRHVLLVIWRVAFVDAQHQCIQGVSYHSLTSLATERIAGALTSKGVTLDKPRGCCVSTPIGLRAVKVGESQLKGRASRTATAPPVADGGGKRRSPRVRHLPTA